MLPEASLLPGREVRSDGRNGKFFSPRIEEAADGGFCAIAITAVARAMFDPPQAAQQRAQQRSPLTHALKPQLRACGSKAVALPASIH